MHDLSEERLGPMVEACWPGSRYAYMDSTVSTNAVLMGLPPEEVVLGMVVVTAGTQTCGRGRLERTWVSPIGGLWFSVLVKPAGKMGLIPLAAGIGVAEALIGVGLDAQLKWPNDVLVKDETSRERKISGILCETSRGLVAVGVGINVNFSSDKLPEELMATTVQDCTGHRVDRGALMVSFLKIFCELYRNLEDGAGCRVIERWKSLSSTLGRNVVVDTPSGKVMGRAVDVTDEGALVILDDAGAEKIVLAGDCKHLRT